MKFKIFTLLIYPFVLYSCNNERPDPDFYINEFTGKILNKEEFEKFGNSLVPDTTEERVAMSYRFFKMIKSGDSLIQPFKYDLRIRKKCIKRSANFEKIGKQLEPHEFNLLNGKSITIGGGIRKTYFYKFMVYILPRVY